MQVLDDRIEVEAVEFPGVVERPAHRIGLGRVLVEHRNVQLVRPPVTIRPGRNRRVRDRAFAFFRHGFHLVDVRHRFTSRMHRLKPFQNSYPIHRIR
jgi:hypothetical protein